MKQLLIIALLLLSQPILAQADQVPAKKGDITIHPVLHSSMVLEWDGKTIFVDPYGGGEMFTAYGAPDLVLITDIHGDHLHRETLAALDLSGAELIAPQAVVEQVEDLNFQKASSLVNGKQANWQAVKVEAIPMYNLPETEDSRHPKGRGNGYVLTLGGKRIYISGDTEDIPEMRKLKNIDVAFVCMNLPYTMDVQQAADAVLDFKPAIVYPFHYRGGGGKFSDVEEFKRLVEAGNEEIEVRLASWYPAN